MWSRTSPSAPRNAESAPTWYRTMSRTSSGNSFISRRPNPTGSGNPGCAPTVISAAPAFATISCMPTGSPAWKPQATLAVSISGNNPSSLPKEWIPNDSPMSELMVMVIFPSLSRARRSPGRSGPVAAAVHPTDRARAHGEGGESQCLGGPTGREHDTVEGGEGARSAGGRMRRHGDDVGEIARPVAVRRGGPASADAPASSRAAHAEGILDLEGDPGRQRQIPDQFPPAGPCHGRPELIRAGRDGPTASEDGLSGHEGGSSLGQCPWRCISAVEPPCKQNHARATTRLDVSVGSVLVAPGAPT